MIFEGLAGGRPLDHAYARARSSSSEPKRAPVVTTGPALSSGALTYLRRPWRGVQRAARTRRDSHLRGDCSPTAWRRPRLTSRLPARPRFGRANAAFAQFPRPRKRQRCGEAWISRLLATQKIVERHVLVFDFSDLSPTSAIREWATRTLRLTDHLDDPDRWLRTIAAIAEDFPRSVGRLSVSLTQ